MRQHGEHCAALPVALLLLLLSLKNLIEVSFAPNNADFVLMTFFFSLASEYLGHIKDQVLGLFNRSNKCIGGTEAWTVGSSSLCLLLITEKKKTPGCAAVCHPQ